MLGICGSFGDLRIYDPSTGTGSTSDMWSHMARWTLLFLVGAHREDTNRVTYERIFQHVAGHGATPKQVPIFLRCFLKMRLQIQEDWKVLWKLSQVWEDMFVLPLD